MPEEAMEKPSEEDSQAPADGAGAKDEFPPLGGFPLLGGRPAPKPKAVASWGRRKDASSGAGSGDSSRQNATPVAAAASRGPKLASDPTTASAMLPEKVKAKPEVLLLEAGAEAVDEAPSAAGKASKPDPENGADELEVKPLHAADAEGAAETRAVEEEADVSLPKEAATEAEDANISAQEGASDAVAVTPPPKAPSFKVEEAEFPTLGAGKTRNVESLGAWGSKNRKPKGKSASSAASRPPPAAVATAVGQRGVDADSKGAPSSDTLAAGELPAEHTAQSEAELATAEESEAPAQLDQTAAADGNVLNSSSVEDEAAVQQEAGDAAEPDEAIVEATNGKAHAEEATAEVNKAAVTVDKTPAVKVDSPSDFPSLGGESFPSLGGSKSKGRAPPAGAWGAKKAPKASKQQHKENKAALEEAEKPSADPAEAQPEPAHAAPEAVAAHEAGQDEEDEEVAPSELIESAIADGAATASEDEGVSAEKLSESKTDADTAVLEAADVDAASSVEKGAETKADSISERAAAEVEAASAKKLPASRQRARAKEEKMVKVTEENFPTLGGPSKARSAPRPTATRGAWGSRNRKEAEVEESVASDNGKHVADTTAAPVAASADVAESTEKAVVEESDSVEPVPEAAILEPTEAVTESAPEATDDAEPIEDEQTQQLDATDAVAQGAQEESSAAAAPAAADEEQAAEVEPVAGSDSSAPAVVDAPTSASEPAEAEAVVQAPKPKTKPAVKKVKKPPPPPPALTEELFPDLGGLTSKPKAKAKRSDGPKPSQPAQLGKWAKPLAVSQDSNGRAEDETADAEEAALPEATPDEPTVAETVSEDVAEDVAPAVAPTVEPDRQKETLAEKAEAPKDEDTIAEGDAGDDAPEDVAPEDEAPEPEVADEAPEETAEPEELAAGAQDAEEAENDDEEEEEADEVAADEVTADEDEAAPEKEESVAPEVEAVRTSGAVARVQPEAKVAAAAGPVAGRAEERRRRGGDGTDAACPEVVSDRGIEDVETADSMNTGIAGQTASRQQTDEESDSEEEREGSFVSAQSPEAEHADSDASAEGTTRASNAAPAAATETTAGSSSKLTAAISLRPAAKQPGQKQSLSLLGGCSLYLGPKPAKSVSPMTVDELLKWRVAPDIVKPAAIHCVAVPDSEVQRSSGDAAGHSAGSRARFSGDSRRDRPKGDGPQRRPSDKFPRSSPKGNQRMRREDMEPEPAPLEISETSWVQEQRNFRKESEKRESGPASGALTDLEITRRIRSILNKLTVEKFEPLLEQLLGCGMSTPEHLEILMHQVMEKATTQHHFIQMYTELCERLQAWSLEQEWTAQQGSFKKILLNECQNSFELYLKEPTHLKDLEGDERQEAEVKWKTARVGNIRFVGELLAKRMVASQVIIAVTNDLLQEPYVPAALESLASFLKVIGPNFDTKTDWSHHERLNEVFNRIGKLSSSSDKVPQRIRCLLIDVLDLRAARWEDKKVVTQKADGPMRLDEVRDRATEDWGFMPRASPKGDKWGHSSGTPTSNPLRRGGSGGFNDGASRNGGAWSTASSRPKRNFSTGGDGAGDSAGPRMSAGSKAASALSSPERPSRRSTEGTQASLAHLRKELRAAVKELTVSHDVEEAATRVKELRIPAEHHAGELSHILQQAAEEAKPEVRAVCFNFAVHLFSERVFAESALVEGLTKFFDGLQELSLDTPALPSIMRSECMPVLGKLVQSGNLSEEQLEAFGKLIS